jgi:AcrR family transcriptional regulator
MPERRETVPKVISDEQILEATLTMIVAHGYEGATTRRIAAAADINEVTLFRKFGSKDRLVLLAVQQELASFGEARIAYTGDLQRDLERIVGFYKTLFAQRAAIIPIIISEAPRRPELRAGLEALGAIAGALTSIIERYQTNGELRGEPPLQALTALLMPVLAFSIAQNLLSDSAPPLDETAYVQLFLQGRGLPDENRGEMSDG